MSRPQSWQEAGAAEGTVPPRQSASRRRGASAVGGGRVRKVVLGLVIALAVLPASSFVSVHWPGGLERSVGEGGAPAGDVEGPLPGEGADPRDDVRIKACTVDAATGRPSMEITVTNSAAWRVAYQLDIAFVTPVRVSFGDHGLATSPLEPGQSLTTTADGMLPLGDHVTCKVTQVTRTPR